MLTDRGFRGLFGEMSGEKLKRVPKGFVSDHPAADLLVYKQFLAGANLPADIVETPKLYRQIAKHFQGNRTFPRLAEFRPQGSAGESLHRRLNVPTHGRTLSACAHPCMPN